MFFLFTLVVAKFNRNREKETFTYTYTRRTIFSKRSKVNIFTFFLLAKDHIACVLVTCDERQSQCHDRLIHLNFILNFSLSPSLMLVLLLLFVSFFFFFFFAQ